MYTFRNYVLIGLIGIVFALMLFFTMMGGGCSAEESKEVDRIEFSRFSGAYRFSGEIPKDWRVVYVPQTNAINIYDPNAPHGTVLEKSQIFIRHFEAKYFLTLQTVQIFEEDSTMVGDHRAVRYEIEKKPGVRDFSGQPTWRSKRHRLIDIRYTNNKPSLFYVFAYPPDLDPKIFEKFILSLRFHNDVESIVAPVSDANRRIQKKPFGVKVSDRFSGFHTGTDFEILPREEHDIVRVNSIGGGKLISKKWVPGYGGVAVQEGLLGDQPITIVYGHLKLDSVKPQVGDYMAPGDFLGILGMGETKETDGERRHLHLGIHKGSEVDLRGYVPEGKELKNWINPESFLSYSCHTPLHRGRS